MRYRRSKEKGATFFFTVVTHRRENLLCGKDNARLAGESFDHVKRQYPFEMDAFVLLPDHIHCIWTLPENDNDFSTRWRLIKSYFSKRFDDKTKCSISPSRASKGEQGIWQRRFWEHNIRNDDDFNKHVEYIHYNYNPVRHGLVKSPVDWAYSSFHSYVSRGIYGSDWGVGREKSVRRCGARIIVGLRCANPTYDALLNRGLVYRCVNSLRRLSPFRPFPLLLHRCKQLRPRRLPSTQVG